MKREAALARRLRTLDTLHDAVGAMKSLSAHHFRLARSRLAPAREYRRGVEETVAGLSTRWPSPAPGPVGLLVVGADLGLCGGYDSRLVRAAHDHRRALEPGPTYAVGHRAAALLKRGGVQVERVHAMPTGAPGVTALLLELVDALLDEQLRGAFTSFHVTSARCEGVGAFEPMRTQLLPVAPEKAPARPLSTRYVSAPRMEAVAVRELVYVRLFELVIEALASEQGARLVATQSASRWVDEQTDLARRQLRAARREASTQELLDLVTGSRFRHDFGAR